jgi:diadenosine tetraphosphatase ApaH/serine/threonine PP2A family protein phosphatase
MFGSFSESLCFVGHSHVPGVHGESSLSGIIKRSERFLVNVGSVGQPRDGNPALSFGLFDSKSWEYKNIRLAYDVERASRKILDAGLPRGLAERIRIGV